MVLYPLGVGVFLGGCNNHAHTIATQLHNLLISLQNCFAFKWDMSDCNCKGIPKVPPKLGISSTVADISLTVAMVA